LWSSDPATSALEGFTALNDSSYVYHYAQVVAGTERLVRFPKPAVNAPEAIDLGFHTVTAGGSGSTPSFFFCKSQTIVPEHGTVNSALYAVTTDSPAVIKAINRASFTVTGSLAMDTGYNNAIGIVADGYYFYVLLCTITAGSGVHRIVPILRTI
jgi:hypothetical protein